jgi:hypothetical protein
MVAVVAVSGLAGYVLVGGRGAAPTTALGPPLFVDETAIGGIDHTYDGPFTFATGGGVALFDCNDDGLPDVFLAGGTGRSALYVNTSEVRGPLAFRTQPSSVTDVARATGAYPIDVDSDGRIDLAVLRAGENALLRGLGDCRFERANEAWGFDGGHQLTTAFSATWERSASLPTLAIGNYLKLDAKGDNTLDCADNAFYRPGSNGNHYAVPIPLTPGYCSLSMLFSDWDRSGRRDLRVSNDRQYYVDGEEQLFRIAPGEPPRAYTDADGWVRVQIWGMGIASYDVTGDGYPEVYLTSQGDNKLQTLTAGAGAPTYRDIALRRGVTATQPFAGGEALPSTAWHPEFADVNDDGFVDLFVSKGNVMEQKGYATRDPSNLFLGQPDGTFVEAADKAGILSFDRGRGAALVDLNLDGLLDLVEVNFGTPTKIWRNVGGGDGGHPRPMDNWLAIRVREPAPNVDAIGAWLEVRSGDVTWRKELVIGGGHLGGQLGWMHVGLGPAGKADVRVTWPDAQVGPWEQVEANGFVTIDRTIGRPQVWQP